MKVSARSFYKVLGCVALGTAMLSPLALAQPPREGEGRGGEGRGEGRGGEGRGGEGRGLGGPEGGGGFGGGRGGRGGPGMMMRMPIMAALDADGNGEISTAEIDGAVAALKKLDKNGDGKLTPDELMPEGIMGFGGPGGPGGGFGGPGGGGMDQAAMITRIMGSDKDGDGFLKKDEMPERMQAMFDRADADKDGKLSKDEVTKLVGTMAEQMGGGGRGGFGGGREGGGREGGGREGGGREGGGREGGRGGEGERPRRPTSE